MHKSTCLLHRDGSVYWHASRLSLLRFLLGVSMVICVCTHVDAQDPATGGQWSAVFSTNYELIHTMVLPTGKVLFWSIRGDSLNPQIWDPATGNITPTPLPGYQVFCAGHSFLGDGQLLVTGGNLGDFVGVAYASLYDPISNTWTRVPNMNAGRWYPTNTTLANGDVLVVSGEINSSTGVDTLAQVWQAAAQSWRDLTTAQLALALYPRMFLAPNGKVFYATPASPSRYLDTSGTGNWTTVANLNFDSRDYDTAVMYAPGKIFTVGGADPPTATAEVIDLNAASPAWRYVGSMATARRQLNGTILADGKVLITGGSSGSGFDNASAPVYLTEIWDPATEQFTPMASITKYRGYHSTAVLLPDGRVLSAGGDVTGATAEIFSPPYLFKGARPTISSGPTKIQYGQPFSISTPDAASITQVNLIRLSSDTHSFNQDQRINPLSFTVGPTGLNIQALTDGNVVPPGPYMLFILNGSGVPSIAQIVQMTANVPPTLLSVSPASGTQGATLNVVLAGSNFQNGATCDFGAGITVSACLFSSATQLTASLTIAPAAAVGPRNVTVTSPHNQSFTLTAGFSVTQGTVGLAPTSLSFDNQAIGTTSPPSAVVLTNQTSTALSITTFNVTGDFIQTNNCGASLASEASCTINISFRPTGQGPLSGVMSVSDSGPNSPQAVTLTGTGTAPPNLSVSPALLDFGSVVVSEQSPSQAVTLRASSAPLSIQGIDVTSSAFGRHNQCPTDLAGDGQCSILVFFQPSTLGTLTATMHIQDDAAGSPQVVQLRGEGSHYIFVPATGSGQVIAAGQSASFSVGLQSLAGMNETVSVSCSVAPALSACTLSQSSFALNGSLRMLTVAVPTTARSHLLRLGVPIGPASLVALWFGVFGTIFLLLAFLRPNSSVPSPQRRLMQVLSAAVLMALATGMISCSGATTGNGGGGSLQTGTQAGQYVVTITGTSSNPANPPQSVQLPFSVK